MYRYGLEVWKGTQRILEAFYAVLSKGAWAKEKTRFRRPTLFTLLGLLDLKVG